MPKGCITARDLGKKAGHLGLSPSLNPYNEGSFDRCAWHAGWVEGGVKAFLERHDRLVTRRFDCVVVPLPSLTGAQVDVICRREGLALARRGLDGYQFVQTSRPRVTLLRIAQPAA